MPDPGRQLPGHHHEGLPLRLQRCLRRAWQAGRIDGSGGPRGPGDPIGPAGLSGYAVARRRDGDWWWGWRVECGVAAQDLLVQGLQGGAGVQAEFLAQDLPGLRV